MEEAMRMLTVGLAMVVMGAGAPRAAAAAEIKVLTAGGSSGIYVAGLLDKLGIAAEVKPKAKLIPGGSVAEHIARGEAELGIHQISEILPVKGVVLVGPLPAEIQNYTVYAAAIGAQAKESDAAKALLKTLTSPAAAEV